jgi:hypothetical protein
MIRTGNDVAGRNDVSEIYLSICLGKIMKKPESG